MFDSEKINKMADKLCAAMPSGLADLPAGIKKHFKEVLTAELGKLNVITQEEFAVQAKVLQKTRMQLQQLEDKISKLEEKNR
jgi:ubiquinone biosynthesis accessory factor UbiK